MSRIGIYVHGVLFIMLLLLSSNLCGQPATDNSKNVGKPTGIVHSKPIINDAFSQSEESDTKRGLEIKKLELEVEKLSKDQNVNLWVVIIQSFTMLAALFAAFSSFSTARKSLKHQVESLEHQVESQKKDRISTLLSELGSENVSVRVAAVQALSEYEDTLPFLVNLLKVEKSSSVISSVLLALQKHVNDAMPLLLEQTRTIYCDRLDIAGRLVALGENQKETAQRLFLNNKKFDDWRKQRIAQRIERVVEMEVKAIGDDADDLDRFKSQEKLKLNDQYTALNWGHHSLLRSIESLIKKSIAIGIKRDLSHSYLDGLMVDKLDLSGWDFSYCQLNDASFQNAMCDTTSFNNISACNIFFKNASLVNATFVGAEIVEGDFRRIKGDNVSFVDSHLSNIKFEKSSMQSADFSHSNLADLNCKNVNLKRACFLNSKIYNSKIHTCLMSGSNLAEIRIIKSVLNNVTGKRMSFLKASIQQSELLNCGLPECDFSQSKLRDSIIRECELNSAIFDLTEMKAVKVDDTTSLGDISWNQVSLADCSERLTEAVERFAK